MSPETRRLLNPAFVANVIAACAEGFEKETDDGLPILYSYLIPSFILHKPTRTKVPKVITSKLSEWVKNNPEEVSLLPQHVTEFKKIIGRSILIGSHLSILKISEGTHLKACESFASDKIASRFNSSADLPEIFKKSYFLGRWLSVSGTVPTVFSILGVQWQNAYK